MTTTPPSIIEYAQRVTTELREKRDTTDRLLAIILEQNTIINEKQDQIVYLSKKKESMTSQNAILKYRNDLKYEFEKDEAEKRENSIIFKLNRQMEKEE